MSSYKSDYSSRRVLSGRPGLSSSYTYSSPTPSRQYVAVDTPIRNSSTSESSYSRTFSSSSSTGGPGGSHTTRTESTTRNTGSGPRTYGYSTESHRTSDGPGYGFSSVSYKSPYGNNYRSFTQH